MSALADSGRPARSGANFALRLRARLLDPANAVVPVVIGSFFVARQVGLIYDIPYWLIVALVLGAQLTNSICAALWIDATSGWRLVARVGVEMAVIAAVVYGIGWGPVLAIGFVFGAADVMRAAGAAAAAPAMVWTMACIGLGQLAVATGLAPTLVRPPLIYGVASLAALGTVIAIKTMEWFAIARESSEARFRTLVQHASDIILVADAQGRLTYMNPTFESVLGWSITPLSTRSVAELVHPDDMSKMWSVVPKWAKDPDNLIKHEVRLRRSDGTWRWFEATVTNHLSDPNVRGVVGNLHDITERKHAEDKLREAHERFRSAFANAPIGMGISDLEGRILQVNSAFGRIVGRSPDALQGTAIDEITHPEDRELTATAIHRVVSRRGDGYQFEKRYIHSDGHEVWACVSVSCVRDAEDRPLYMIGQIEDVTERRALRERLAYAAVHDPLTGLPNRILFADRLEVALSRGSRQGHRVAVAFLDLDHFKLVNDSMGHDSGDQLLIAVANLLQTALRSGDTVGRLGGDEFTVLFEEVENEAAAFEAAERLINALSQPIGLPEGEVYLTVSLGLALSGHPGDSPSSLLSDADTAMYNAKEKGGARMELFDQESHRVTLERMHMSTALHRAMESGELRVYYQPIVDLKEGRLVGMEALLRWQHPQRGLLGPGEFLRLAEDSGLIVAIGDWVLHEACRQFVRWESERKLRGAKSLSFGISVNLSPRQLLEPDLGDRVEHVLESTAIEPRALWLEITEGALVGNAESTLGVLHDLRALGVGLSIDDFGSGYSSLSYLKRFPVEAVKIDRSFVDGLEHDASDATIVKSVVALARSLGLVCIAEGVEERQQLNKLNTLGCRFAQGFLLGVPLPAETLGEKLTDDLSSWAVDSSSLFHPVRKTA